MARRLFNQIISRENILNSSFYEMRDLIRKKCNVGLVFLKVTNFVLRSPAFTEALVQIEL